MPGGSIWRAAGRTSAGRAICPEKTLPSGLRSWPEGRTAQLAPSSYQAYTFARPLIMKIYLRGILLAALALAVPGAARAGDLQLTMQGGRVTIIAHDVPLRQILQEWSRVGNTQIVNGEKLAGPPLTLELIDVPEQQALDTLLRSAAGYMAAPRRAGLTGASGYDRIMILATSHAPAASAAAAPPPAFQPRPQPMPVDDD